MCPCARIGIHAGHEVLHIAVFTHIDAAREVPCIDDLFWLFKKTGISISTPPREKDNELLRIIGLSDCSIMSMLISFDCTVPAIMATRILPSKREWEMTILLMPCMGCIVKLSVCAFFVDAFFPSGG